jgi:ATP/maltotriose-dependent transcriptional regulator MalT
MNLLRKDALDRFEHAGAFPVTLVVARAGFGKSTALAQFLATREETVVRYAVARSHASLSRFARALAAALDPFLPRVAQSLAIAHERALQSPVPSDVLAAWLAEHLGDTRITIAIDEFHHCEAERAVLAFLASAIERTRGTVRWIVALRSSAEFPLATWLARGDADIPIDESVLRLSAEEGAEIAAAIAPDLAESGIAARVCDATGGVPSVYRFALETIAREPGIAERLLVGGGGPFERFAAESFEHLTLGERDVLLEAAALPDLDDAFLRAAGLQREADTLDVVEARAPYLFTYEGGLRRYHGLFSAYLWRRSAARGAQAARESVKRAAFALERAGRTSEALATFLRDRHDAEVARIIESRGFSLLESGYGESLHEAIDALDPLVQLNSPVTLAIKAMAESRVGRFDTAESWFQLALDRAPAALRAQIAYQYGNHLTRFFRKEAVDVLEGVADDATADEALRGYAYSALGPANVCAGRIDEARARTDVALEIAERVGRPHLLAKAQHQAAYVALYAGDAARAKSLATMSLEGAKIGGYFDISTGALTVLYNVASDLEDDPTESLRLLEAVADYAAKSGSLVNQLFAIVASLEIEVERGDEESAERIDAKLRTLDVTFGGRALYEALLPSQAMRSSWAGDFTGAYHVLAGSAEKPWSPDRRALRYAEIATYAASAGFDDEALAAMRSARETLGEIDVVDLRVQRARLFLAFAATLLGSSEEAAGYLQLVDEVPSALSDRLRVLRRALGALLDRYRGARNQNEMLAHLAELDAAGFGGIARFVMSLPLADNAVRRVGRLDVAERVALLRWADGDESAAEPHLRAVLIKLGSLDRVAVLRAVRWHRELFEVPESASFGTKEATRAAG